MSYFLRGLIIGFSIAAPVGPIGILCIRRTLSNGRASGFLSGLGAASADACYGSIAALGLSIISGFLIAQQAWLRLVGGAFLCYLGVKTIFESRSKPFSRIEYGEIKNPHLDPAKTSPSFSLALLADYSSTILLTLTNPMTILSFVAIFAGLGLGNSGGSFPSALMLVLGVFSGSALWWLILSTGADLLRVRFLRSQGLRWVNWISGLIITGFGLAALVSLLPGVFVARQPESMQAQPAFPAAPTDTNGFLRADGPRPLSFPADFGPHPGFQTEWWYYTGNLSASDGRHFGFQLTFFRRALLPPEKLPQRASNWASGQAYMAHFALTDVKSGRYQAFERLSRGAVGLAGAQAEPYQVWLDDWQVEQISTEQAARLGKDFINPNPTAATNPAYPSYYHLAASQNDVALDLGLADRKGPVLQGDQGYSRKGAGPGQASYYYSLTRLAVAGTLQTGGQSFQVVGNGWMDHEFSTSALGPDQVGWDWFSIQVDDGSEIMVFQIRKADGSVDSFSSGILVNPDGSSIPLSRDDFQIQVQSTWKSPHTGAVYPARWEIIASKAGITLQIEPYLADQELKLSYTYWEGAVHAQGTRNGKPIQGDGYVELTGYAGAMGGEF